MKPKILLIEKKRAESPTFYLGLVNKGYTVDIVPNGNAAADHLVDNKPDLMVVNAASIRSTGLRICKSAHHQVPGLPIVLIVETMPDENEKVDADVILALPFTLQKLINRIRSLLPGEPKNVLKAGDLQLDVENRFVKFRDKQATLTPRLVTLLKILIDHVGEVVERKDLFRQVWDTDYTEDMRTLDVHVSWLRQLLEEDPRHPQLVKTVRGVGYWLDVKKG